MNRATRNEEDYLKMLLRFKMTGDDIGTNHLAAKLHVAPPSVTSMLKKLKSKEVEKLKNTDAGEIKPGAQGRRNVRRLANKYGRNVNRVLQQVKSKQDEPSIVGPDGDLIAGNTRAMVRRSLNRPVKALVIK